MEKTAVCTTSNLVDDVGFEVNVEGTGNVFSGRSFREKGAEPITTGRGITIDETAVGLVKEFVK